MPSLLVPNSILGRLLGRSVEDLPEEATEEEQFFDAAQSLGDFEASYEDDIEYEDNGKGDAANDERNFMYSYLSAIQNKLRDEFHPKGKKGRTRWSLKSQLEKRLAIACGSDGVFLWQIGVVR